MSKRTLRLLLEDMLECVVKIRWVMADCATYEGFLQDLKTFHAAMSLVTILGEAAAQVVRLEPNLPTSIPWHEVRGLRNRLVHEYFDIDSELLWTVVTVNVPSLESPLQALLDGITS